MGSEGLARALGGRGRVMWQMVDGVNFSLPYRPGLLAGWSYRREMAPRDVGAEPSYGRVDVVGDEVVDDLVDGVDVDLPRWGRRRVEVPTPTAEQVQGLLTTGAGPTMRPR